MKHYVTPTGYNALLNEFNALGREERPQLVETVRWAAGNGDRSENGDYIYGKKRLREIDRRLRYLNKQIESAIVVDPGTQQHLTQVFFGATVTYENKATMQQVTLQIVGKDEALMEQYKISYLSPVAKALFKAKVGDEVVVNTPNGEETLKLLEIQWL